MKKEKNIIKKIIVLAIIIIALILIGLGILYLFKDNMIQPEEKVEYNNLSEDPNALKNENPLLEEEKCLDGICIDKVEFFYSEENKSGEVIFDVKNISREDNQTVCYAIYINYEDKEKEGVYNYYCFNDFLVGDTISNTIQADDKNYLDLVSYEIAEIPSADLEEVKKINEIK